jgi:uncharacterized protein (TIGR00255 family)
MMDSMTGFGQAQVAKKGERFVVTLKSVNHRYFETLFHLPPTLEHLEALFRSKIQEKIKRGRVNISISHINEASETVVLNQKLVEKYYQVLDQTRKRLRLSEGISVASLVSLPGVLSYKKEELKESEREALIRVALEKALKKMTEMRRREGQALALDLVQRIRRISRHMATVKKQVKSVIEANKKAMSPENWESFLRSTDVSEEVTRIDFHLKSFLKHAKVNEPKGKVLDFIGQELQREINTLGAKVQEKHVAYQVVMIKDQIEKIREQVQNVE